MEVQQMTCTCGPRYNCVECAADTRLEGLILETRRDLTFLAPSWAC